MLQDSLCQANVQNLDSPGGNYGRPEASARTQTLVSNVSLVQRPFDFLLYPMRRSESWSGVVACSRAPPLTLRVLSLLGRTRQPSCLHIPLHHLDVPTASPSPQDEEIESAAKIR